MESVCRRALAAPLLVILVATIPLHAAAQNVPPSLPATPAAAAAATPPPPPAPAAPEGNEPTAPAASGTPPPTAPAVAPFAPQPGVPLASSQEAYDQQFIGFDDVSVVVVHDGIAAPPVSMSTPYEGKFKRPLVGVDFYRKLGRLDLVEAYQSKERLKTGLLVGGGLAIVAALVVGIALSSDSLPDCGQPTASTTYFSCVQAGAQKGPNNLAIGLSVGLTFVGGGLFWAGAALDPDPVTPWQARQLADQYNQALQQGLSAPPPEPFGSGVQLRLEPRLYADGGGLVLGGRF